MCNDQYELMVEYNELLLQHCAVKYHPQPAHSSGPACGATAMCITVCNSADEYEQ